VCYHKMNIESHKEKKNMAIKEKEDQGKLEKEAEITENKKLCREARIYGKGHCS